MALFKKYICTPATPATVATLPEDNSNKTVASVATVARVENYLFSSVPMPNGGRDLPHYCEPGGCWCSAKLPGGDYPAACSRGGCEHRHASQESTQTANERQGILALA